MTSSSNLRGILAIIFAMGVFVTSDAIVRMMFQRLPLFELIMIRGELGMVLAVGVITYLGQSRFMTLAVNPWVLARGLAEGLANAGFMVAIKFMPMADVTSIVLNAPLLLLLGAWLLYGEKVSGLRIVLIAMGAAGALLVAQPGSASASPYVAVCVAVSLCVAFRDLITRKAPNEVPALVGAFSVLFFMSVVPAILMFATETFVMPQYADVGLLVFAAALMVAGHSFIYFAYKTAEPRAVAPFMYTVLVWSALAGFLVFDEVPNAIALVGMALIVVAGVGVVLTDGRKT